MDGKELEQRLLANYNLRVEPQTLAYLSRRLIDAPNQSIPILGGQSRTGIPIRLTVDPKTLFRDSKSAGADQAS